MKHEEIQKIYENHYYFCHKGQGSVKSLNGNVVVIVFFVNDEESKWTQTEINSCKRKYESAFSQLYAIAKHRKVNFKMKYAIGELTVPMICERTNKREWDKAIATGLGKEILPDYQEYYKKKHGCDEAPIMFVFNKPVHAYASNAKADTSPSFAEYSVLGKDDNEKTIIHELLHQCGAMDLYFPELVLNHVEKIGYNSIMVGKGYGYIDSLTSYLIGWSDEINDEACTILDVTKHITDEIWSKELDKVWEKFDNEQK